MVQWWAWSKSQRMKMWKKSFTKRKNSSWHLHVVMQRGLKISFQMKKNQQNQKNSSQHFCRQEFFREEQTSVEYKKFLTFKVFFNSSRTFLYLTIIQGIYAKRLWALYKLYKLCINHINLIISFQRNWWIHFWIFVRQSIFKSHSPMVVKTDVNLSYNINFFCCRWENRKKEFIENNGSTKHTSKHAKIEDWNNHIDCRQKSEYV